MLVLALALLSAPAEIPAGESCTMPDDQGVWRTCEEVLREREEERAKRRPASDDPEEARGGRVAPDMSGRGVHTTPEPPRRGGYMRQVPTDSTIDLLPLVQLRNKVAQTGTGLDEVEGTAAAMQEIPGRRRAFEIEKATLAYVEVLALREVRLCVTARYPEMLKDFAPPAAFRMTAGGPVPTTPDEQAVSTPPDPLGCERVHLIKQETIDKARRLQVIERLLKEDEFGWGGRDEKAAMKKEREALLEELQDPFRVPRLKATKRYESVEPTPMPVINPQRFSPRRSTRGAP